MEKLGLYDKNGINLNESICRKNKILTPKDKYYKTIIVFIINEQNKYLIQKASYKKGNIYETLSGHVKNTNTSIQTIIEELKEELSISIDIKDINYFKKYIYKNNIQEIYYIKKNINIEQLIFQKEEVSFAKWLNKDEIKELIKNNNFRKKDIIPFYELNKYLEEEK